ncbi:MAG: hypothetical protein Q7S84_00755 [bacterium]|nr:hypothetical protein [bacterium]
MTALTLFTIAGNEDSIIIISAGPDENGKYSGWITHGPDEYCRPIVSTPPVFNTAAIAEEKMRALVKIAKEFTDGELKDPESPIVQLFASPEGQAVQQVLAQVDQIGKTVERDIKGK